ncbi:MAG: DUF4175 domain-containing protein [Paracoccaceae bacterium]
MPRRTDSLPEGLEGFSRPIRLTWWALLAERGLRAFWPVLSLAALVFAAMAFGARGLLPPGGAPWALGALALAFVFLTVLGLRGFRLPRLAEAVTRIDARLPGRPLAALGDRIALGESDGAARALWAAHQRRMRLAAAAARPGLPAPDLAPRDPFALRITALTALVVALIFGAPLRVFAPGAGAPPPGAAEAAMGPSWEGWAEPPRYTGKPGLYLNRLTGDRLELPEGTRFAFRFYGAPGAIALNETVSSPAAAPVAAEAAADPQRRDFEAMRSGAVTLEGPGGRTFVVEVLPDDAPEVTLLGLAERRADGKFAQPFMALDDYGVQRGRARIVLDLAAVPRRYGLSVPPEPRPDLVFDLPMPISGARMEFTETLVEDAARHPWANLPVKLELEVEDGRGQTGRAEPYQIELPGRRFFDPLAAALIEARRDLLWNRSSAPRIAQWLRAITHLPEGFIRRDEVTRMLRMVVLRLEAGDLADETVAELADTLWSLAELLEDGGLADALAAMQRAQERLSEAMRNGASKDEIAKLMQELKEATDTYLRMRAERAEPEEGPQFGRQQPPGQQITGDQIQQMMDEIQKLMEEGRMAEAQELLDQLARMMENLKVTQGQGGEGDMPGGQAMRDLGETLRRQQDLSDDAFRQMQRDFLRPEPPAGLPDVVPPGRGAEAGSGGGPEGAETPPGASGEGGAPPEAGAEEGGAGEEDTDLAARQRALREELGRQQGLMPRPGNEAGEAARERLDEAGRAMEQAEEALREGDDSTAIDRQADAIEALREGMRALGQALRDEQSRQERQEGGETRQANGMQGQGGREVPRDPLGRAQGEGRRIASDQEMLQGEDIYRRARDLLDEIRRRTGERLRPEDELSYLRRLLGAF